MKQNPKLEGSNVIDCIPQTGKCSNGCVECYYNHDGFFTDKKEPLIPTLEEVGDKIVRVNSGHDSNLLRDLVIETTKQYKKKFYSTSIPRFDFPGPVVFTCNGKYTDEASLITCDTKNLMAVRFRTNMWNLCVLHETISFYNPYVVPVLITFMRYMNLDNIPEEYRSYYEEKKSILNTYYILKQEYKEKIYDDVYDRHNQSLNFACALKSSYCKDCGNCEKLYNDFVRYHKREEK
jgi:hypothetical protein